MENPRNVTEEKVSQSVAIMAELIPFFPRDDNAQLLITKFLYDMASMNEELDWLTKTASQVMKKWEGFAALRGLYCSRYKPADGLPEVYSDIPGFRPDDIEAENLKKEAEVSADRIEQWKQEMKKLPPVDSAALSEDITALKQLPAPAADEHVCKFEETKNPKYKRCACGKVEIFGAPEAIHATPIRTDTEREAELRQLRELVPCPHEHLNENGICRACGEDKHGAISLR